MPWLRNLGRGCNLSEVGWAVAALIKGAKSVLWKLLLAGLHQQ
jgi:hypothetical protein